jgi:hypothetical protein
MRWWKTTMPDVKPLPLDAIPGIETLCRDAGPARKLGVMRTALPQALEGTKRYWALVKWITENAGHTEKCKDAYYASEDEAQWGCTCGLSVLLGEDT